MRRATQCLFFSAILSATIASAADQIWMTPPGGALSGQAVSAQVTFSPGDGFITATIANTLPDPTSAAQLLSGLAFTLDGGQTAGDIGPNAANIRRIGKGGKFTDLGPSLTGWALEENFSGGLRLCVLCTDLGAVGPSHLLIGDPSASGVYRSANGSIAGNRPHNPFTTGQSVFLLYIPGVTADTQILSATFYFGTQDGVSVTGIPFVFLFSAAPPKPR
jgi:hypothetical protein